MFPIFSSVSTCFRNVSVSGATETLHRNEILILGWESVLESHFWDLPKKKSDILPALLLSYHHLPSHLKLCFAFCAIIPKDYAFKKDELVPLWIAEGFVEQPRANKRIEEIGDGYFRELISRSLFQQSSDEKFLMHNLINWRQSMRLIIWGSSNVTVFTGIQKTH